MKIRLCLAFKNYKVSEYDEKSIKANYIEWLLNLKMLFIFSL